MRRRRGWRWALPGLLTLTVMFSSCIGTGGPATNTPPPVTNTVTNTTPAPQPPVTTGDAAAGKTIYEMECAKCHDVDGTGKARMGRAVNTPDLHDLMGRRTDEQLIANITNGVGKMDAYGSKLSADDIENVVAYLRKLIIKQ